MAQKKSSDKIIWGVTLLLALAMVGGAYLYKRSADVVIAPPLAPTPQVAEVVTVTEEEIAAPAALAALAEPSVERAAAQRPEPADEATVVQPQSTGEKAVLDLSNVAGLIKIEVPFLNIRNKMPLEHSCFHQNASPELSWSNAPSQTQSYVVFMEHRDSLKTAEDYDLHWLIYNIDAQTLYLPGAVPRKAELDTGIKQALNYENMIGYSGPCQPQGQFDYALRVFALDTVLDIPGGVDRNTLIHAMNGHIIDMAEAPFIHYRRL